MSLHWAPYIPSTGLGHVNTCVLWTHIQVLGPKCVLPGVETKYSKWAALHAYGGGVCIRASPQDFIVSIWLWKGSLSNVERLNFQKLISLLLVPNTY